LNERGIIPLALALIVAGAILISGFMIAYHPEIHCSVGKVNGKQEIPTIVGGPRIDVSNSDRSILQLASRGK